MFIDFNSRRKMFQLVSSLREDYQFCKVANISLFQVSQNTSWLHTTGRRWYYWSGLKFWVRRYPKVDTNSSLLPWVSFIRNTNFVSCSGRLEEDRVPSGVIIFQNNNHNSNLVLNFIWENDDHRKRPWKCWWLVSGRKRGVNWFGQKGDQSLR